MSDDLRARLAAMPTPRCDRYQVGALTVISGEARNLERENGMLREALEHYEQADGPLSLAARVLALLEEK